MAIWMHDRGYAITTRWATNLQVDQGYSAEVLWIIVVGGILVLLIGGAILTPGLVGLIRMKRDPGFRVPGFNIFTGRSSDEKRGDREPHGREDALAKQLRTALETDRHPHDEP